MAKRATIDKPGTSALGRAVARAAREGVSGSGPALSPGSFEPKDTPKPVAAVSQFTRPDLLFHPYKAQIEKQGLDDFFSDKDNVDFHASRGWRIFQRPTDVPDENVVFHPEHGRSNVVTRGDLVLMVRPKALGEAERAANLQAHLAEVEDLSEDLVTNKAPALGTTATKSLQLKTVEVKPEAPSDELH